MGGSERGSIQKKVLVYRGVVSRQRHRPVFTRDEVQAGLLCQQNLKKNKGKKESAQCAPPETR